MLKIFIARHGQNVDNANGILNGHRDEPLTDTGIEQATEAAQNILTVGLVFDHVYTSPLIRARRTAEIISVLTNSPTPVALPLLIERDFGVMTGIEQNRVEELCSPEILRANPITYFLSPEGAETFPDLLVRANALLEYIKSRHTDGNILLVTHGDFGKMIYTAYYGLNWKDVLLMFHFGNSELLQLSEDSSPEDAHVFKILQHNH